jgi:hypothetical protein
MQWHPVRYRGRRVNAIREVRGEATGFAWTPVQRPGEFTDGEGTLLRNRRSFQARTAASLKPWRVPGDRLAKADWMPVTLEPSRLLIANLAIAILFWAKLLAISD